MVAVPATNLWATRSRPVLAWFAENEAGRERLVGLSTIADATGLTAREVEIELERLESDRLIVAEIHRSNSSGAEGWFILNPRLTGEGARRLDLWPQAESLLVVIERMAGEAADPEEKSRLQKLAASIKEAGLSVLTDALTAAAKVQFGLP